MLPQYRRLAKRLTIAQGKEQRKKAEEKRKRNTQILSHSNHPTQYQEIDFFSFFVFSPYFSSAGVRRFTKRLYWGALLYQENHKNLIR